MRQLLARASLLRSMGIVLGLMSLILAGCGDGRIATYPVNGTVNVNGRPAEGAIVVFCPINPAAEIEHLRPAGMADASGQFTLTTFEPSDGAPAGQYKVIVKWPAPTPASNERDARPGGANKGPDRLRGKYYNLETTPLAVTIEEQSNALPPFELKSS
jgi:hypothetical protein